MLTRLRGGNLRNLSQGDCELLRNLDETGLLQSLVDSAMARLFKDFVAADADSRYLLGHTADALTVLGIEVKQSINEEWRNGRIDTDAA